MRDRAGEFTPEEEVYYQNLLQQILEHYDPPEHCAVLIEGSVAEGFSNPCSDVDVVFLVDTTDPVPVMRTQLHLDRRIEVFQRSTRQVRELAERINKIPPGSRPRHIEGDILRKRNSEDDGPADPHGGWDTDLRTLHLYQMFSSACQLKPHPIVDELRQSFDPAHVAGLLHGNFCSRAEGSMLRALAFAELGHPDHAVSRARWALLFAAKAWVGTQGETYMKPKFVEMQMQRAGVSREIIEGYSQLANPGRIPEDADSYLADSIDQLERFGVEGVREMHREARIVSVEDVSAWELGGHVYLLKGERDFYVLSELASRMWRSLEWGTPLVGAASASSLDDPRAATSVLSELHENGLLAITWRDGAEVWRRTDSPPPPSWTGPFISARGACFDEPGADECGHVRLLPLPARSFVIAGAELFWAQVVADNSWEDFEGGYQSEDWSIVSKALQHLAAAVGTLLCASYGMAPLPAEEDCVARIGRIDGIDPALARRTRELEFARVESREQADAGRKAGEALLASLPRALEADFMRNSHHSKEVWDRILAVAFEWMQLAHRLGAPIPMPEGRELLTFFFGGKQKGVRDADEA